MMEVIFQKLSELGTNSALYRALVEVDSRFKESYLGFNLTSFATYSAFAEFSDHLSWHDLNSLQKSCRFFRSHPVLSQAKTNLGERIQHYLLHPQQATEGHIKRDITLSKLLYAIRGNDVAMANTYLAGAPEVLFTKGRSVSSSDVYASPWDSAISLENHDILFDMIRLILERYDDNQFQQVEDKIAHAVLNSLLKDNMDERGIVHDESNSVWTVHLPNNMGLSLEEYKNRYNHPIYSEVLVSLDHVGYNAVNLEVTQSRIHTLIDLLRAYSEDVTVMCQSDYTSLDIIKPDVIALARLVVDAQNLFERFFPRRLHFRSAGSVLHNIEYLKHHGIGIHNDLPEWLSARQHLYHGLPIQVESIYDRLKKNAKRAKILSYSLKLDLTERAALETLMAIDPNLHQEKLLAIAKSFDISMNVVYLRNSLQYECRLNQALTEEQTTDIAKELEDNGYEMTPNGVNRFMLSFNMQKHSQALIAEKSRQTTERTPDAPERLSTAQALQVCTKFKKHQPKAKINARQLLKFLKSDFRTDGNTDMDSVAQSLSDMYAQLPVKTEDQFFSRMKQ